MRALESRVGCSACGATLPPDDVATFRCPRAGDDDTDHVLAVSVDLSTTALPSSGDPNPFVRFRELSHTYRLARRRGLGDEAFVDLVRELDRAVAGVDGRGFSLTPCLRHETLGRDLGLARPGGLWIKDETRGVAGSHKARHLFGLAVHLAAAPEKPTLAISSCGNAALAAAVVAKAAGRALEVFVPTWADRGVVARLQELGAEVVACERSRAAPGDPCWRRFREAVGAGAFPFSVQGSENGLVIEGGKTLGWELAAQHAAASDRPLDRVVVQVGGGALASSVVQALEDACSTAALASMPRIHAVQTEGCAPLHRAWRRFVRGALWRAGRPDEGADPDLARAARGPLEPASALFYEERYAASHRSEYMWPWEQEPKSVATGILDDETYDWRAIVRAMVATGGWPVVVGDAEIEHATARARALTGIPVSHTGAAGLAGLYALARDGHLEPSENVAVLFTGVER